MSDVKTSSIVYTDVKKPEKEQFSLGTWTGLIPALLVAFVVLKLFVYIKDHKRDGK